MTRTLLGIVLALVPASAGTSAPPKPLSLTAVPARLVFHGSGQAVVRLRNPGSKRLAVEVAAAGFALDLRGRPHVVGRRSPRSAAPWLRLSPVRLTLAPRATALLRVSSQAPRHAEPGDHDALVLVSASPLAMARVSVRLRLGVVVIVRAPGAVVRHLTLGRLRVMRRAGKQRLGVVVVNAGNVTERLVHASTAIWEVKPRRHLATVAAGARELRPRTRGLLEFGLRTRAHGPVTARVVIPAERGRPGVHRTYRMRL